MIIFLVILFILIIIFSRKTKENFSSNDIKTEINNIYRADIEAIRNLSNYASYLMNDSNNTNSVTVPGIIKATNKLSVNNCDREALRKPTKETKITGMGIQFGCNNENKNIDSAQISAGVHDANSLNIVGMSNDTGDLGRRVTIWSEGGTKHLGDFSLINYGPNLGGRFCINSTCINEDELKRLKNNAPDNNTISIGDKSKNHWKISTDGETLKFQRSDYNWTGFDPWGRTDTDKPLVVMAGNGNIWADRSKNKGWIADNLENTVRFEQAINLRSLNGPSGPRILSTEHGSSDQIGATWRPHDHNKGDWEALRILRN